MRCIDDEITFEIPESWNWTRISTVCTVNPRNNVPDDLPVSFVPMSLIKEGFTDTHYSEDRLWSEIKNGFTHFCENDIGVAKITPCFENRKSVIFRNLKNGIGAGTTELHILRPLQNVIFSEYLLWIVKTNEFITGGVQTFSSAVGQQRVSKDYVASFLIPLPPYNEQKKICSEINHMLAILDRMEEGLN